MKVREVRPHQGGAMAGLMQDVRIIDIPETDAAGNTLPLAPGAVRAADDTHDWETEVIPQATGGTP
jgi:hypothetical protein